MEKYCKIAGKRLSRNGRETPMGEKKVQWFKRSGCCSPQCFIWDISHALNHPNSFRERWWWRITTWNPVHEFILRLALSRPRRWSEHGLGQRESLHNHLTHMSSSIIFSTVDLMEQPLTQICRIAKQDSNQRHKPLSGSIDRVDETSLRQTHWDDGRANQSDQW
jgi:hypothetical protein